MSAHHSQTTSTPQNPSITAGTPTTRPAPARTDSIADHIITTGISRTKEVNEAWKSRNDENIENKKNSWKTITSFIGTVACCCLVLGLVLDILKIHTSRFWISLPVRIALFSILAFFEFPSLYIEIVGLMGKNSVPETVELGAKSYGVLRIEFANLGGWAGWGPTTPGFSVTPPPPENPR